MADFRQTLTADADGGVLEGGVGWEVDGRENLVVRELVGGEQPPPMTASPR